MKFRFDLPEELRRGAELLSETGYNISAGGDFTVTAVKKAGLNGFKIEAEETRATVYYDEVSRFFYALAHVAQRAGEKYSLEKRTQAERIGLMRDCARNAVISVSGAKRLIAALALSGYNYLELYAEDLMEIPEYPYLGISRGRFKGEEIKELTAYAGAFGMELVPCIQTLAHLNAIFRLDAFNEIHDRDDILLADEEKTYEFIDKILEFCEKNFASRHINIGMDEAHAMFLGKYLDKHGYRKDRATIFMRHLNRVLDLCRKHGFKPAMWSDMIFKAALGGNNPAAYTNLNGKTFDPEFVKNFPKDITLIYWDYYHFDKKTYNDNFTRHFAITDNVMFAGGVWTWVGFAPLLTVAEKSTDPAVKIGLERGCKDFLFTAWGDAGGETSTFAALGAICYAAERLYGETGALAKTLDKRFNALYGNTFTDFQKTENLNYPLKPNGVNSGRTRREVVTPAKYTLYNDPLLGILDKHVAAEMVPAYKKCAKEMKTAAKKGGAFSYIFRTYADLAETLVYKATLGLDITAAYKSGDKSSLEEIAAKRIPVTIKKLEKFYESHRYQWLADNKSIGFEVSDIRIGGLIMRLKEAKRVIEDYLRGDLDRIEELEQPRLPVSVGLKEGDVACFQSYEMGMTGSIL